VNRRTLLLAALTPTLARAQLARAQGWPARPVRIVVPFPPGGATDFVTRPVAARLQATLGQPVVIENRAGAGGTVGSDLVAKAPPDGHTLVVSNVASHGVGPSVYPAIAYDAVRDFTHIALLAEIPSVLVVRADSTIASLADLVAAARSKAGGLSIASPGNGSSSHAKQEMLKRLAGIETTHVPYRGSGPALNDLAAGAVDAMITTVVEGRNERFRALAITSAGRLPGFAHIPTFRELGFDIVASTWFGLSGPAGLPAPIAARLNAEVLAALAQPDIAARLAEAGAMPRPLPADAFAAFVADEVARWRAVARAAGMRAE
jgi:tripartite-type tricarboxylate transporter receptor subunit TctC